MNMANTNVSNAHLNETTWNNSSGVSVANPWKESGALVYVALTVLTFSAVVMCFVWSLTRYRNRKSRYSTVDGEEDEEEIELALNEEVTAEVGPNGIENGTNAKTVSAVIEESTAFTFECSSDENDEMEDDCGRERKVHDKIDVHALI
jgi:hypothetical protein